MFEIMQVYKSGCWQWAVILGNEILAYCATRDSAQSICSG